MQSVIITSFTTRARETRLYIDHVLALAEPDNSHIVASTGVDDASVQLLQKMHKAACLLALYNLVESTARLIMSEIAARINSDGIKMSDLPSALQRSLVRGSFKDLGRVRCENVALELMEIAYLQQSVTCFPEDDVQPTSGNVDARWIRALASCYGFSADCGPTARNGADLLKVKDRRNGLAHGNYTFADCGKDFATLEVKGIAESTISYLADVVNNVSQFLANREFSIEETFRRRVELTDSQRNALLARFREPRAVFKADESELLAVAGMDSNAVAAVLRESTRLGYRSNAAT